ncbi:MAG: MFS transporter [Chitinophagaceae bacterium]|nr:MFS transporter [Chitinophagaceae bacterium]
MADIQTNSTKGKMPRSVPFIIGNEAAERFSFYGIRSIMSTFLVAQFFNPTNNPSLQNLAEARSNELVHLFVTFAYFMPLVGGILADWFFGKYKVILYVSIIYALGNLILAFSTHNQQYFVVGLIVIAIAAGGIKSCVSANVGDQFDKSNQHLMSKVYGWFYFSINSGSVLSTLLIPVVYSKYGPEWAFGIPGILMCIATIVFWSGRKKYVKVASTGMKKENFVAISFLALKKLFSNREGKTIWESVGEKYSAESIDGVQAVYRILMVFAFTPIFWALWDQNLSEWVLQAKKMDLHIFGQEFLPEQIQTFNPLFLVSMIPVCTYFIFPFFEKIGLKPTPLRKIGAGLFLTGVSFLVIALIQQHIDAGGKPTIWWQVLAYFILAVAEILVSMTCLEYAYTQSPKSMKSTMTALYLLAISVGNLFVSIVNGSIANGGFFSRFTGAAYFWLFLAILGVFFVLYLLVASRLPEKSYLQEEVVEQP